MHAQHLVTWLLDHGGAIAIDFPQHELSYLDIAAAISHAQHFEAGPADQISDWTEQMLPRFADSVLPFSVTQRGGALMLPFDNTYLEFEIDMENAEHPEQPMESGCVMVLAQQENDEIYLKLFFRNNQTDHIWDAYMGARIGEDDVGPWIEFAVGGPPDEDASRQDLVAELGELIQVFCNAIYLINLPSMETQLAGPALIPQRREGEEEEVPPPFAWRVLTLKPDGLADILAHGGHHLSPRAHVRRRHLRRLGSGRIVEVKACVVGDADRGVLMKDYRLRMPGQGPR